MGDGINVGLNGVVFVFFCFRIRSKWRLFLTRIFPFPSRVGNLLMNCETVSSHEVVLSWGLFVCLFVCYYLTYLLNKPVQKLHEIFSCSIDGITVRLSDRPGRQCLSRVSEKHCR
jgi:hypothetical protein